MTNEIALCKAISTSYYPQTIKRLGHSLRLLNLSPAVYIPVQKTATHKSCRIVRKFLAEW